MMIFTGTRIYREGIAGVLMLLLATRANAADIIKAIPIGPFDLIPLLNISESYNDNIFWNNNFRRDSMLTQIRSGLQLALQRHLDRYALNYSFNSSQYHSSPHDNYVDQYVGGQAHVEFTSRNRLDIDAKFIDAHNLRGTSFNQGVFSIENNPYPDEYIQNLLATKYRYGGVGARGNLELLFNLDDLTYQNHRDRLAQWDRTLFTVTPGFYYRVFPKTYLSAQVEAAFLNYKNDLTSVPDGLSSNVKSLNYDKQRYLFGFTWDYSAITTSSLRMGYLQQNFTDSSLPSVSDFTWDVGVQWAPKTYSRFNLNSSKDILPTFGYGYLRLVENVQLSWIHDWTERISSQIYGIYQHVDNNGSTRIDDFYGMRFGLSYELRQWLGLGISYTYYSQSSGGYSQTSGEYYKDLNYDQNMVMFYISANPFASQNFASPWQLGYGY